MKINVVYLVSYFRWIQIRINSKRKNYCTFTSVGQVLYSTITAITASLRAVAIMDCRKAFIDPAAHLFKPSLTHTVPEERSASVRFDSLWSFSLRPVPYTVQRNTLIGFNGNLTHAWGTRDPEKKDKENQCGNSNCLIWIHICPYAFINIHEVSKKCCFWWFLS